MQKAKAQCTSHLAAMALLRVVVGCLLVLAAAAEGATPMTVTFQARPAAFDLKDDTFTFDWQPGTTQRVTLKPLRNDAGGVGLTIVGLKNINGMVGTVLVPSTNPRVIIYRATVPQANNGQYTDTFVYEVLDPVSETTKTARVTVKVGPSGTGTPKGAKPDSFTITGSPGQTLSKQLNVLANDVGSQLTIMNNIAPLPVGSTLKGTVQVSADGQRIIYTVPEYNGVPYSEAFRYRAWDKALAMGAAGAVTAARVDVTVGTPSGPGGQPVSAGHDKFQYVLKYGTVNKTWDLPVLDNDKGNGIGVTSLLDKSVGFRGEISIPAGRQSITYELPWTYEGAAFIDKFKYIIRNSTGQSAQASVTIQVTPEPLKANPDTWRFKLDDTGNLAPVIINPFANDTGFIAAGRLTTQGPPTPAADLQWNNVTNYYTFSVTGYRGPSFSFTIECTLIDERGNIDSTVSTVFVDASSSPIVVTLNNDAYTTTGVSNGFIISNMRVLENDTPVATLSLVGVEPVGTPRGTAEVESSKTLLVYKLDSTGLAAGTMFTDTFRYSAVDGTNPTIYKADVIMTVTIT